MVHFRVWKCIQWVAANYQDQWLLKQITLFWALMVVLEICSSVVAMKSKTEATHSKFKPNLLSGSKKLTIIF